METTLTPLSDIAASAKGMAIAMALGRSQNVNDSSVLATLVLIGQAAATLEARGMSTDDIVGLGTYKAIRGAVVVKDAALAEEAEAVTDAPEKVQDKAEANAPETDETETADVDEVVDTEAILAAIDMAIKNGRRNNRRTLRAWDRQIRGGTIDPARVILESLNGKPELRLEVKEETEEPDTNGGVVVPNGQYRCCNMRRRDDNGDPGRCTNVSSPENMVISNDPRWLRNHLQVDVLTREVLEEKSVFCQTCGGWIIKDEGLKMSYAQALEEMANQPKEPEVDSRPRPDSSLTKDTNDIVHEAAERVARARKALADGEDPKSIPPMHSVTLSDGTVIVDVATRLRMPHVAWMDQEAGHQVTAKGAMGYLGHTDEIVAYEMTEDQRGQSCRKWHLISMTLGILEDRDQRSNRNGGGDIPPVGGIGHNVHTGKTERSGGATASAARRAARSARDSDIRMSMKGKAGGGGQQGPGKKGKK